MNPENQQSAFLNLAEARLILDSALLVDSEKISKLRVLLSQNSSPAGPQAIQPPDTNKLLIETSFPPVQDCETGTSNEQMRIPEATDRRALGSKLRFEVAKNLLLEFKGEERNRATLSPAENAQVAWLKIYATRALDKALEVKETLKEQQLCLIAIELCTLPDISKWSESLCPTLRQHGISSSSIDYLNALAIIIQTYSKSAFGIPLANAAFSQPMRELEIPENREKGLGASAETDYDNPNKQASREAWEAFLTRNVANIDTSKHAVFFMPSVKPERENGIYDRLGFGKKYGVEGGSAAARVLFKERAPNFGIVPLLGLVHEVLPEVPCLTLANSLDFPGQQNQSYINSIECLKVEDVSFLYLNVMGQRESRAIQSELSILHDFSLLNSQSRKLIESIEGHRAVPGRLITQALVDHEHVKASQEFVKAKVDDGALTLMDKRNELIDYPLFMQVGIRRQMATSPYFNRFKDLYNPEAPLKLIGDLGNVLTQVSQSILTYVTSFKYGFLKPEAGKSTWQKIFLPEIMANLTIDCVTQRAMPRDLERILYYSPGRPSKAPYFGSFAAHEIPRFSYCELRHTASAMLGMGLELLRIQREGREIQKFTLKIVDKNCNLIPRGNIVPNHSRCIVSVGSKNFELDLRVLVRDLVSYNQLLDRFPLARLDKFSAVPRRLVGNSD